MPRHVGQHCFSDQAPLSVQTARGFFMSKSCCSSFPPGHDETNDPDNDQEYFARGDNRLCVHKRLRSLETARTTKHRARDSTRCARREPERHLQAPILGFSFPISMEEENGA